MSGARRSKTAEAHRPLTLAESDSKGGQGQRIPTLTRPSQRCMRLRRITTPWREGSRSRAAVRSRHAPLGHRGPPPTRRWTPRGLACDVITSLTQSVLRCGMLHYPSDYLMTRLRWIHRWGCIDTTRLETFTLISRVITSEEEAGGIHMHGDMTNGMYVDPRERWTGPSVESSDDEGMMGT